MIVPKTLREQLMWDEGFRRTPYRDSVGKLTIGFGRNLDDVGISQREAGVLLDNDIATARDALWYYCPWVVGLDVVRQEALVNMTFNLGIVGLLKFTKMLKALQRADWSTTAREALDSTWARQVGDRAQRLAQQLLTGERR